jgi:diamine N-acetyltransferase
MKESYEDVRFLESKNIYLRPFLKDDIPFILYSYNDYETRLKTGDIKSTNYSDAEKIVDRKDESRIWFAVVRKSDNKVIGETGLTRMFPAWRTTDLSIIIPNSSYQHQGYGTEAINLLMNYAFGHLNFNRIAIGVIGLNDKALDFYEKVGFKKEGIQEEGYYCNYKYYDFIMMRILKREFIELHQGEVQI